MRAFPLTDWQLCCAPSLQIISQMAGLMLLEKEIASILNRLTNRDRPNSHVIGQKKLFLFFNLKLIVVSNTILGRGEAIWFI